MNQDCTEVSSFKDEATAEMAYRELLKRHWREIYNWLKDPHSDQKRDLRFICPLIQLGTE